MDTWVWHEVGLELSDIDVKGTIESEGSGKRGDNLSDESVKVGVGGSLDVQSSSADIVDQASSYTDKSVEMKALNRSRKLISKINSALQRIKDGTYGFCEETGEPIGLKRLMARPVATLSIEAQERHERDEKIFIED